MPGPVSAAAAAPVPDSAGADRGGPASAGAAARRAVLIVLLTALLSAAAFAALAIPSSTEPGQVLQSAVGLLLGFTGIALALLTLLSIVVSIRLRRRSRRRRVIALLLCALLSAIIDAALVVGLSSAAEGWGSLISGIALASAGVFVLAASASILLLELAPRASSRAEPGPR
ncbi:hypothetical protein OVN18_06565 [Microcella daejeonensis]|uniref:Uncharacterized protein n=1 Tax=Microcella daejeonensis TaxID=2994971 RepID=A0A9E8SAJ8_9MICO|nr:hypothetical protein [Microcella daejeonensis]WAB82656.1 hypothetical protein OVN18_06565 [Microcella daejeonensis]